MCKKTSFEEAHYRFVLHEAVAVSDSARDQLIVRFRLSQVSGTQNLFVSQLVAHRNGMMHHLQLHNVSWAMIACIL